MPVPVVQNVVQVVGNATADAPQELRCPHCRKRLVGVVAHDVELIGCAGCGGIWIDNTNATKVLAKPEDIFAELAKRAGDGARNRSVRVQNPSCPVCTAVLDRVITKGIELDVCREHGTWFDAFELLSLVHALQGRPAKAEFRPGDTREILCAGCKQKITADRANITELGLLCEPCWRAHQTQFLAEADKQTQREGVVAVGGLLLGVAAVMLGGAGSSQSS